MELVRELRRQDIPRVADLYRRVFSDAPTVSQERLASFFARIYFDHPWYDERVASLVYESQRDGIVGFLGVTPRPLLFKGERILSAIGSSFMVDPRQRSSVAAMPLLKEFFSGPQDLSLAEGNDFSYKLWTALGGTVSLLQSINWLCPLRPLGFLLHRVGLPGSAGLPIDALITRIPASPFRRVETTLGSEELSLEAFVDNMESFGGSRSLRPLYTHGSAGWLFDLLERKKRLGTLRKTLLRDSAGHVAGWCLWYDKPGDVAQVVQLVSRQGTAKDILAHLAHRALGSGAVALSGRLEPGLVGHVPHLGALFGRAFSWMLIRSQNHQIHDAIQTGDALFTRLEGEWWLHYAEE